MYIHLAPLLALELWLAKCNFPGLRDTNEKTSLPQPSVVRGFFRKGNPDFNTRAGGLFTLHAAGLSDLKAYRNLEVICGVYLVSHIEIRNMKNTNYARMISTKPAGIIFIIKSSFGRLCIKVKMAAG